MSVPGEFQRHLMQLIERLQSEPGPEAEALAARLEAVAADTAAPVSARARRVLEALEAATTRQDSGDGCENRATLAKICRIVLGC